MESFQLDTYLSEGVKGIVKGIIKSSIKNPKAGLFMMRYQAHSRTAEEKRLLAGNQGEHIPPFLIASITQQCNLHCKGCYARATHGCLDDTGQSVAAGPLSPEDWDHIFVQASELGISFILLAGGEPFVRKDVLEAAGSHPDILFPVFTNGTMMDEENLRLLDQNRNLLPVLSIEGNMETTDARRGTGIYHRLQQSMKDLKQLGILFGASVTVTKENMEEVLSDEFVDWLQQSGVRTVIYVEYVPMDEKSRELAPDDAGRSFMMNRLAELRAKPSPMVFIAFPGDEKSSGGCLAAGRGFFHINAHGGAEPCPFSPYSDTNVVKTSLREAMRSPLFTKLKESGSLTKEHVGGCTLFAQQDQVKGFLDGRSQ